MKITLKVSLLNKIKLTVILFFYIFSFTIYGPITSSIFVGALLFKIYKKTYRINLDLLLRSPYSRSMLKIIFILFCLSILYPTLHLTFDFYFTKVIVLLLIQLIIGCIIWTYLITYKILKYSDELYSSIIVIFIIQSIIQCIVSFIPSLLPIIYYFNNAQTINESYTQLFGSGVRGVAMAGGTGFSLSLAYGIAFIVFIRYVLPKKISIKYILYGVLIIVGVFFAGRTGFVGVAIGFAYYLISPKGPSFFIKMKYFFKVLIGTCFILLSIYLCFPKFSNHIVDNVLPFAFEPIYNLVINDSFETASTNDLGEMWQTPITDEELIFGAGRYFEPGSTHYYKRTDIGLFKNIFYWGFLGYIFIIIFQLIQLFPLRYKKINFNDKLFFLSILLFLWGMDFKAISLSLNKTAFSMIILIVFDYEKNIIHNCISSFKNRCRCQLYSSIIR